MTNEKRTSMQRRTYNCGSHDRLWNGEKEYQSPTKSIVRMSLVLEAIYILLVEFKRNYPKYLVELGMHVGR